MSLALSILRRNCLIKGQMPCEGIRGKIGMIAVLSDKLLVVGKEDDRNHHPDHGTPHARNKHRDGAPQHLVFIANGF